ncbi:MAG: hypothetical protein PHQ14_01720 [Chromatiales bacterium]|nr:hypothetical protein [Chromatiales bacterium]
MIDSRRSFLRALLAGLAATQLPAQAADAPAAAVTASPETVATPPDWGAAAARLSGIDTIDAGLLRGMREALLAHHAADEIDRLAAVAAAASDASLAADLQQAGLADLAQQALAILFGASRLADFDFTATLAWEALGYTKPPSYCGPQFGDWAHPPAEKPHG